jgi:tRNA wybutosine-synthesizing protein 3
MLKDDFDKRKKDILSKEDKSSKRHWDKRIKKLCEKINGLKNYYTTSSCAGRILILIDSDTKKSGLFLWVSHDLVTLKKLKNALNNISSKSLIKFKQEPCILHVACRSLKDAQSLLNKAKLAGWKKSGIIASGKRFVVEMMGTDKLEFYIMEREKVLVDDDYLSLVVKKSNENLKKSWEKIGKLEKSL